MVDKKPLLAICDMQTRFRIVIDGFDEIETKIVALAEIFNLLSYPTFSTTQTKNKLGETVTSIAENLTKRSPSFDKALFSMTIPEVLSYINEQSPDEIVLVGIETQICVAQTALDLQRSGHSVTIIADAVSSSSAWEREWALRSLQAQGINIISFEGWVFQTLKSADHPDFRRISSILKRAKAGQKQVLGSKL